MSIFAKFLVYFGGAFLGISVIIMSFLRRRMINHSRRARRKKRMQEMLKGPKR